MAGAFILELRDTMSLIKADLGSVYTFTHPNSTTLYLIYTSACTGELNAIRKQNAFSAVLSTEGRVVGPCWKKLKPEGPKGGGAPRS